MNLDGKQIEAGYEIRLLLITKEEKESILQSERATHEQLGGQGGAAPGSYQAYERGSTPKKRTVLSLFVDRVMVEEMWDKKLFPFL